MSRINSAGGYIMPKSPDWKPVKLSDTTYFTQQFIPLDTIFYHPTINGVEEVPYRQFLRTDQPPINELYFSKDKAETKAEKIKNNEQEEDDDK